MLACTWVDCQAEALHPQLDRQGKQWACLCQEHHDRLEKALTDLEPKGLLSCWVKAQGGAKAAARRLT
jgi:hypothetical protein